MSTATFTQLEKQIIASIQGDMPIVERPYLAIAERLGVTEDDVLETLRNFGPPGRHPPVWRHPQAPEIGVSRQCHGGVEGGRIQN